MTDSTREGPSSGPRISISLVPPSPDGVPPGKQGGVRGRGDVLAPRTKCCGVVAAGINKGCRSGRRSVEVPRHAAEAAEGLVRELRERGRGEVEVPGRAALAAVRDRDGDLFAVV